jgi:mono/diheme cytochrome c family protein
MKIFLAYFILNAACFARDSKKVRVANAEHVKHIMLYLEMMMDSEDPEKWYERAWQRFLPIEYKLVTPKQKNLKTEFEKLKDLKSLSVENRRDRIRIVQEKMLSIFNLPVSPAQTPDMNLAKSVYAKHCASCHGVEGDHKTAKMRTSTDLRSSDYLKVKTPWRNFILLLIGLKEKNKQAYNKKLSVHELWSLSFYVASLGHKPCDIKGSVKLVDIALFSTDELKIKYPQVSCFYGNEYLKLER